MIVTGRTCVFVLIGLLGPLTLNDASPRGGEGAINSI